MRKYCIDHTARLQVVTGDVPEARPVGTQQFGKVSKRTGPVVPDDVLRQSQQNCHKWHFPPMDANGNPFAVCMHLTKKKDVPLSYAAHESWTLGWIEVCENYPYHALCSLIIHFLFKMLPPVESSWQRQEPQFVFIITFMCHLQFACWRISKNMCAYKRQYKSNKTTVSWLNPQCLLETLQIPIWLVGCHEIGVFFLGLGWVMLRALETWNRYPKWRFGRGTPYWLSLFRVSGIHLEF